METLQKLKRVITAKCPGMIDDIILLHNNDHPHVAQVVLITLQKFCWKTLTDTSYNPGPSPSDFHIFRALKNDIRSNQFASDEDWGHTWVQSWFKPRTFFHEGTDYLVFQWDKSINNYDDYF